MPNGQSNPYSLSDQDMQDLQQIQGQLKPSDPRFGKITALLATRPPVPSQMATQALTASGIPGGAAPPVGAGISVQAGSSLPTYALGAANVATGAGQALLHTIYTGGDVIRQATGMPRVITDPSVQAAITPTTGTQRVGYGLEQAGEYMLPSTAAESALGRVGLSALGTGAISKFQGHDFTTGALLGAAGQGAMEGVAVLAPKVAETALGVRPLQRAYGKTPGPAAIAETTGIAPATIAASADRQIQNLTSQLENAARAAPGVGSVQPAIDVLDNAINTAIQRNNYAAQAPLQQLRNQLTQHVVTGQPLPIARNAEDILNAKRGIGDLINSWNPETRTAYTGVRKQIYNALDNEFDQLVPESQDLNQRISSLIPVRDRARAAALAPDIAQRVAGRFGARTGALVGAAVGGGTGYRAGGIPGAVIGGLGGLIVPEVLASPGFQMTLARAMANPAIRALVQRGGIGALMQLLPNVSPTATTTATSQ